MATDREASRPRWEALSTFAIIGDRYLDTQHDDDVLRRNEEELARRGVVGLKRWFLEYLAASGLWWNAFGWEWVALDGRDVLAGWAKNAVVFGIVSWMSYLWLGPLGAAAGLVLLHGITTALGFELRGGSRLVG